MCVIHNPLDFLESKFKNTDPYIGKLNNITRYTNFWMYRILRDGVMHSDKVFDKKRGYLKSLNKIIELRDIKLKELSQ